VNKQNFLKRTLQLATLTVLIMTVAACGGGAAPSPNQSSNLSPTTSPLYVKVCNSGDEAGFGNCPALPALGKLANEWACTKDKTTGLIWEVKTSGPPAADNFRSVQIAYTNYDGPNLPQLWEPGAGGINGVFRNPKQSELELPSNALGFIKQLNGIPGSDPLCGSTLWRRPTQTELESLLDLKVTSLPATSTTFPIIRAAIDEAFFPNTNPSEPYVSSTPSDKPFDPVHFTNNITFKTINRTIADQLFPWQRDLNYRAPLRAVSAQPAKAAIATGFYHTCALKIDGKVYCWGYNDEGQIGSGTLNAIYSSPTQVPLMNAISAIATGSTHSCAVDFNGNAYCWGSGAYGQLGNGSSGATVFSIAPVPVTVQSGIKSMTAGAGHTCAIKTNNEVVCWGANGAGQLGNGTNVDSKMSVAVNNLGPVTAISAGGAHTCALKVNGDIACWGDNTSGQFGTGTTVNSNVPVVLTIAGGVTAISAASPKHVCALKTNGDVTCWGDGSVGQLGTGTTANSLIPSTPPAVIGGFKAISDGLLHTCAIKANADVACWGSNTYGALGNGTNLNSSVPVTVQLSGGVKSLSTGFGQHTCAIRTDGSTVCWGGSNNSFGQLGNGTNGASNVPVAVVY
jgi:alpha-tubulin suppressor-like RCC1 family protein